MKSIVSAIGIIFLTINISSAQSVMSDHNGAERHGAYIVPGLTPIAAATMAIDSEFKFKATGITVPINAQPLFWAPPGQAPELIITSENNSVFAVNPATGAIIWQQSLGPALTQKPWRCGNIYPLGIMGTGVIDPKEQTLYVDATSNYAHQIYALSLADGSIRTGYPLNISAALTAAGVNFPINLQYERGGALLFQGHLYVSFGGDSGDCPKQYHGIVVEVDPTDISLVAFWQSRIEGAGIWGRGGVVSDSRFLYVTTGNAVQTANAWSDSEAVLRLRPGLAHSKRSEDFYTPANWQALDANDLDLGSVAAIPLEAPDSSGNMTHYMFAAGKDGNVYLLNRDNLGGNGGPATILPLDKGIHFGQPAVYQSPTETLVAVPAAGNVTMLSITAGSPTPMKLLWSADIGYVATQPIITTSDGVSNPIVWIAYDGDGQNGLVGFDAQTGQRLYNGVNLPIYPDNWSPMIAADNRLYLAANGTVAAFSFTKTGAAK